jgi:hypothetical protein
VTMLTVFKFCYDRIVKDEVYLCGFEDFLTYFIVDDFILLFMHLFSCF